MRREGEVPEKVLMEKEAFFPSLSLGSRRSNSKEGSSFVG